MKTIKLNQGSAEWHELRQSKMTASEAPTMMGVSKYQSRGELLHQKATGDVKAVNAIQQRIFDKGHAAEEAARPVVEQIIGEELYPTTGISDLYGWMLASFDGITLLDDVVYEHKLWNDELAKDVMAEKLSPHYYWQLEQQLLVSGAGQVIFVCSDLTDGQEPVEGENFVYCWYESQTDRRDMLIAGWLQFMEDLANYQPPEKMEKLEAQPIRDLPAISYRMEGLTLRSNLDAFKDAALDLVEQSRKPIKTDQDFANAEAQIKIFKSAENKIVTLSEQVLGEVHDIDTFVKDLKFIGEQVRQARLATDKQVKARKSEIRKEIAAKAQQEIIDHLAKLSSELSAELPVSSVSVLEAMKGKKTVVSLQEAADTAVANAKIEADRIAIVGRTNRATLDELATNYRFLFNDWPQLAFKPTEDFTALVKSRIADHQVTEEQRLKAERTRLLQEEEQRAKAAQEKPMTCVEPEDDSSTHIQLSERSRKAMTATRSALEASGSKAELKAASEMNSQMTEISAKELSYLRERDAILSALEAAGVDRWDGFEEAMVTLDQQAA